MGLAINIGMERDDCFCSDMTNLKAVPKQGTNAHLS